MASVAGDPRLNGLTVLGPLDSKVPPRGPNVYNTPTSEPTLGAPLVGAASEQAAALAEYYKARIFWLGSEGLARKYGVTFPVDGLTPCEAEEWGRLCGVVQRMALRIGEILS